MSHHPHHQLNILVCHTLVTALTDLSRTIIGGVRLGIDAGLLSRPFGRRAIRLAMHLNRWAFGLLKHGHKKTH